MKNLSIIIVLSILLSSCASKKHLRVEAPNSGFSKQETEMILSAGSNTPMRVYIITNHQDSVLLRTKSTDVVVLANDIVLKTFSERLYATVRDSMSMGVGIAAPQVGILKKLIWVQRFDKKGFPFELYLNPKITTYTKLKQDCPEGCLSIPDIRKTTTDRSYAILIEYDKMDNSHHFELVEDFTAVIFQHEIDHLNGILFIDHLLKDIEEAQ